MNPVSIANRGIVPFKSQAGKLKDHMLTFNARGMADIKNCEGDYVHGVLHLLSAPDMKKLADLEAAYNVEVHPVEMYDGEIVQANTFKMPREHEIHEDPSERYIIVITQGAEHFKLDRNYIDNVIKKVKFIPSKSLDNLTSIPEPTDPIVKSTFYDVTELPALQEKLGENGNFALCAINGKVLKITSIEGLGKSLMKNFAGKDITMSVLKNINEPRLPPLNSHTDVTPIHLAWAEDFIYERIQKGFFQAHVIGYLKPLTPKI